MSELKLKTTRSAILLALFFIPLLITTYLLVACIISFIPTNKRFTEAAKGVDIYIQNNGVHTDIVIPIATKEINWNALLKPPLVNHPYKPYTHIAFGWGDKAFYLNTPQWSDLKPGIALKAFLGLGPSALHIVYYPKAPDTGKSVHRLRITEHQYHLLIQYILDSFEKEANGEYKFISSDYNSNNAFYESKGRFTPFYTCNTWTNQGLKKAGIRTCLWTPFPWPIMMQLNKIKN